MIQCIRCTHFSPIFQNTIIRKGLKIVDSPTPLLKDGKCLHPKSKYEKFYSPVTGELTKGFEFARIMRRFDCGFSGKFFNPKP